MLNNFEEKIEAFNLHNKSVSKASYISAQHILSTYKSFASSFSSHSEFAIQFRNLPVNNEHAIEETALFVTAACYLSIGKKWHIPGQEITWNIIPRITQIAGGMELCKIENKNCFAQQQTGEGKTVTLLFAIAYYAKKGSVHVLTANEYLAKRDHMWVGPILTMLGISNSWLSNDHNKKYGAYGARVMYGADKEFTFDYLHDTVVKPHEKRLCNHRDYAVIDEADHIMLDELSTPIVLSQSVKASYKDFITASNIIALLKQLQETTIHKIIDAIEIDAQCNTFDREVLQKFITLRYCGVLDETLKPYMHQHYKAVEKSEKLEMYLLHDELLEDVCSDLYFIVDSRKSICYLTEKGMHYIEDVCLNKKVFTFSDYALMSSRICKSSLQDLNKKRLLSLLTSKRVRQHAIVYAIIISLQANTLLRKDRDYLLKNGTVELITKSIGRSDAQKKFNQDLSLAVELKEGIKVTDKTVLLSATVLPHFISLYTRFIAISGTIFPDHEEFANRYGARLFTIPSFKKVIAHHDHGWIYESKTKKHEALIKNIHCAHRFKRPILIGTNSVEYSEELSTLLTANGFSHKVLNARNEFEEAEIIAKAGDAGSIVIATHIAGRGTDITVTESTNEEIGKAYIHEVQKNYINGISTTLVCYSEFERDTLLTYADKANIPTCCIPTNNKKTTYEITVKMGTSSESIRMEFNLGLHVIISEAFLSRRIENQLRGRTGRQGSPGSSSQLYSLEDDTLSSIASVASCTRKILFDVYKSIGRYQIMHNYFISIINRTHEGEEREKRKERLFYDSITEMHRIRLEKLRTVILYSSINDYIKRITGELIDDLAYGYPSRGHDEQLVLLKNNVLTHFNIIPAFLTTADILDKALIHNIKTFIFNHYLNTAPLINKYTDYFKNTFCEIIDSNWSYYLEHLLLIREQSSRSNYMAKDNKVYYIDLVTEYFNTILFEIRKTSVIALFHKKLPHEVRVRSTVLKNDPEDELLELLV